MYVWSAMSVSLSVCSTALAVAGADFAIVCGDTRMSDGYTILSREQPKIFQLSAAHRTLNHTHPPLIANNGLTTDTSVVVVRPWPFCALYVCSTDKCVLSSAGMQADAATLRKVLTARIVQYRHRHNHTMSTPAIAQLLSNTLYYKRFFPYYTFNVLGGLDEDGAGAVYGYDAIGSFERIPYGVTGSASALITSVLDNQIEYKTAGKMKHTLSLDEMIDLVKDAYTSAGERDIYTGDSVQMAIITKEGVRVETFVLKKD